MQMFIAVINENFDVAEEAKRKIQESRLLEPESKISSSAWVKRLNPYRWFKRNSTLMSGEDPPPTSVLGESERLVEHDPLPIDHGLGQVGPTDPTFLRCC